MKGFLKTIRKKASIKRKPITRIKRKSGLLRSIKKRVKIKRTPKKPRVKRKPLRVKPLPWQDQQEKIYSNTKRGRKNKLKDQASKRKLSTLSSVTKSRTKRRQKIRNTMTNTLQNATINPQSRAGGRLKTKLRK